MRPFLGIGLLFITIGLSAQSYPSRVYTVNDGLSQSSVYDITQDSLGYMWFGTGDGLTRFDGRNFKRFHHRPGEAGSLVSNTIRGIIPGHDGYLWVGSDDGLEWYDPVLQQFNLVPHPDLRNTSCTPLYVKQTNVFVHVEGKGLGEYDFLRNKWRWLWEMGSVANGYFRFGLIDRQIIFGYQNGLLIQLDPALDKVDTIAVPPDINYNALISLAIDGNKHINFAVGTEWWKKEDNGWKSVYNAGLEAPITALFTAGQEGSLVGVEGIGIYRITPGFSKKLIWSDPRFTSGPIYCFYQDQYGQIWASVEGLGVVCLGVGTSIFDRFSVPLLRSNFVKALAEDRFGRWWVGYNDDGVQVLDPQAGKLINIPALEPLAKATIFSIESTSNGDIWLNTSLGLYRYFNGQLIPDPRATNNNKPAQSLWITPRGELQGAWSSQIITYKEEGWIEQPLAVATTIRTALPLQDGSIALGTDFGFFTFEPRTGQISAASLTNRKIRSFWQSNDSILWVATTTGLYKLDLPERTILQWWNESTGLPNDFVYSVLGDGLGYLWLSTNRGLCRLNPSDGSLRCFSVNHGLQSMEFNTNAFTSLNNGDLLFGGVGGFNVIHPSRIPEELPAIPIVLTDLQWQGKTIEEDVVWEQKDPIRLPYADSRLSFELQPMIWPDVESYSLLVKLEGQDEEWLRMGQNKRVSYTNLNPGDYRLLGKVQSTDGRVGKEQLLLSFHVGRPWWRTLWFYGILVLSIALVAGGMVALISRGRYRKKVREAELQVVRESLRVQLARDIHDDLGAGLSKIALMSELGGQESDETLPEIASAARDLIGRMGEIIWAMEPGSSNWEDLVVYFRSYGAEYLEHSDIELHVQSMGTVHAGQLNPGQKRNLLLIFKEALRNVMQHSNANRVEVLFQFQEMGCIVKIMDYGTAISQNKSVLRGRGYRNMKDRTEEMGGSYSAGPILPVGWKVELYIPYPIN